MPCRLTRDASNVVLFFSLRFDRSAVLKRDIEVVHLWTSEVPVCSHRQTPA